MFNLLIIGEEGKPIGSNSSVSVTILDFSDAILDFSGERLNWTGESKFGESSKIGEPISNCMDIPSPSWIPLPGAGTSLSSSSRSSSTFQIIKIYILIDHSLWCFFVKH